MKVNKKLLQQHLSEATRKVVTLKDITNIHTGLTKPDENNLESVVSTLRKIEGILVEHLLIIKWCYRVFILYRIHCRGVYQYRGCIFWPNVSG